MIQYIYNILIVGEKMHQTLNFKSKSVELILEKNCFQTIKNYFSSETKKLIITDSLVPQEYIKKLQKDLNAEVFIFPSGEKNKNIKTALQIISYLTEKNYTKSDYLFALGGGVCLDLVGFVAAIYKRGINFVLIPSTSLAQIDSCVGGKTGVDFENYKNLIGVINQPNYIFCDPNLLKTLPVRHLNNGLVEALKIGICLDKNLYDLFLKNTWNLEEIITLSLKNKIEIVLKDENDNNERQILNFGHSFGHALESQKNFKLLHGEAIGNGMLLELKDKKIKEEVKMILKRLGIPLLELSFNEIEKYLKNDKKIINDEINLCMIEKIGQAKLKKVNLATLKEWFDE